MVCPTSFAPCIPDLLMAKTLKLRFFMFLSFPLLCHGFQRTLLNHGLLDGEIRDHEATLLRKIKQRPKWQGWQSKDKQKEFTPKTNCFLCDGSHWARDCPKRKALNAMIEEKEQEGDAKVGSLQLLNALKAKMMPKTPQSKGLMYVEALVNKKATKALVDTGATHNFVSQDETRD
ncbi:hypothetical protein CK203_037993 [Vitis vinifera]|uniref:CCHC-type domain-containing protein n=1 Tax=Vitis vinifera TaxID=29760 RepID=A0A438HNT5_VITVI|nr:hypothetical protein CK203_037993 [Vitis vinifera]